MNRIAIILSLLLAASLGMTSCSPTALLPAPVKPSNPPVTVTLNRIGVYDNREDFLRGRGEVYIGIVVSDGETTVEKRFPPKEGCHYSLDKNETEYIGEIVFSVNEVGDFIMVSVIGYESDGGALESIFYKAMGMAAEGYIYGGALSFLELFEYNLGNLLGAILGAEDDWLGAYERTWRAKDNWGAGDYVDIPLEDERGVQCLRLWFTISTSK